MKMVRRFELARMCFALVVHRRLDLHRCVPWENFHSNTIPEMQRNMKFSPLLQNFLYVGWADIFRRDTEQNPRRHTVLACSCS